MNMKHYFQSSCRWGILIAFVFSALSLRAQSLKVMTYNIRLDTPADGINQWDKRKEKVLDLIRKYDPAILGVQEALHHQLTDITSNLNDYTFIGVGRDDGKQKGEFSAILYKKSQFHIIDQNTFWLSETPDVPGSKNWDAAITRVATWTKMHDKKNGKEFLVINTHFDHIGSEARIKSAALLKVKAAEIGAGLPVIITGDFNCTRDEAPYKTMMEKSGLKLNDPAPQNAPGTFCNFGLNSQPCRAIDYIFYSDHWQSQKYLVIDDNDGKNYPSDHLPVMITLIVKNN
jgi:endonuclease/exonuclease/phosphatase family metal-dependent hydrolase